MEGQGAEHPRPSTTHRALPVLLGVAVSAMMGFALGQWLVSRPARGCGQGQPPYITRGGLNVTGQTFYIAYDPSKGTLEEYRDALDIDATGATDKDTRHYYQDGQWKIEYPEDTTHQRWSTDETAVTAPGQYTATSQWWDEAVLGENEKPSRDDPDYDASVTILVVAADLDMEGLPESEEETIGGVVFDNWDDDNGTPLFMPDKNESFVVGENDLVELAISLSPAPARGLLRLEAPPTVQAWATLEKGDEIPLPAEWDLSAVGAPARLYLEGVEPSGAWNDFTVRLSYAGDSTQTSIDEISMTCVKLLLGSAVYRSFDSSVLPNYNHAGMLIQYNGARARGALQIMRNWTVLETRRDSGVHLLSLFDFMGILPFYGYYGRDDLFDQCRNQILYDASCIFNRSPAYTWPDAVNENWNGTWAGLEELRCDGLVEAAYEKAFVDVWGQYGQAYLIQVYPNEHNTLGMEDPEVELSPFIQRGAIGGPTRIGPLGGGFEPQN